MFKNKVVMLTGVTGSLGLEILSQLIKHSPAKLVLLGRNKDRLLNVQNICRANNIPADLHQVDFSQKNLAEQLDDIFAAEPKISILIQNAGYLKQQSILGSNWSDIELENRVNYLAPALLARKFCSNFLENHGVAELKSKSSARLINILSLACIVPAPSLTGYSASKMAYKHFCDAFRQELRDLNIVITNCMLGQFQSNMTKQIKPYKFVPSRTASQMAELLFNELRYFPYAKSLEVGFEVRGAAMLKTLSPAILENITRFTAPNLD